MVPRPPCMCMIRRRHSHEPSSISKSSRIPRCKICAPLPSSNVSANGSQPILKRTSGIPEKIKSPILDEKAEQKLESTSRMFGYKKCITGSKYKNSTFKGLSAKDTRKVSRKSILECDVTAYDLIKKVATTPSVTEIDDSDIDDNLNDNALSKSNQATRLNYENEHKQTNSNYPTPKVYQKQIPSKRHASKFKKAQSENCIYNESHSVLVGGQRIFTDNHSKSPILSGNLNSGDELDDVNRDAECSNWRKMSESEESVCIPDPDYDFSDDSDDSTVINSNYMDPKFTYSPPPVRKPVGELYRGLGYGSRELSKSMSSLQSDDTFVASINTNKPNSPTWRSEVQDCDKYVGDMKNDASKPAESDVEVEYDELFAPPSNILAPKQDSKYESSSDCSSSGGTLSSDYPTWTSSSSSELKSILKNKKRRERNAHVVQDASMFRNNFEEIKDIQRKKQVQFKSGSNSGAASNVNCNANEEDVNHNDQTFVNDKLTPVIDVNYESLDQVKGDKNIMDKQGNAEEFGSSKGKSVYNFFFS